MLFLISHRGFNSKYKENTLEGIKYALNLNYISGVEFDVRVTKDKRFVLVHDFYIDRVTNSTGLVNHLTLKELLKYNFGTKTYPSKITTLDEVLNRKTNKILLLEIKFSYDEYIKVRKRFIKLIKKYKNKLIYIYVHLIKK